MISYARRPSLAPPAAAAFNYPRRLWQWQAHTVCSLCEALFKWPAPSSRAPISSFNGFWSAWQERRRTTKQGGRRGIEQTHCGRRAPRSSMHACILPHLLFWRSLFAARLFPSCIVSSYQQEQREHDMCTICGPSYTNHAHPAKPHTTKMEERKDGRKEGRKSSTQPNPTQKTEKLGGTDQALYTSKRFFFFFSTNLSC